MHSTSQPEWDGGGERAGGRPHWGLSRCGHGLPDCWWLRVEHQSQLLCCRHNQTVSPGCPIPALQAVLLGDWVSWGCLWDPFRGWGWGSVDLIKKICFPTETIWEIWETETTHVFLTLSSASLTELSTYRAGVQYLLSETKESKPKKKCLSELCSLI